jgi:hypothetical protein
VVRNSHIVLSISLLFSASSLLLATGFQPLPMLTCTAGVIGANLVLVQHLSGGELLSRPIEGRWLLACLICGLALALLGGEGHFFFAKDDWLGRDAVLADLVDRWSPVRYTDGGTVQLLRAPLGLYLLPAAIGRLFGLGSAHLALLAQTSVILGGFFYCVTLVWPRQRSLFIALFVLFSGLDVIPVLIKTQGESLLRYLVFWVDLGSYPANLAQLFWAPNHALPGWWFAALAALHLRREVDLAALAAASASLALWSPLSLAGAAALLAFFAFQDPRGLLNPRVMMVAAAGFLQAPIMVYLGVSAGDVPHNWQIFDEDFASLYPVFISFALTQIFFLAALWRRVEPWFRSALLFSIFLLLLIPTYNLGFMNDCTQRVSTAPRALLALGFNAVLIDVFTSGAWLASSLGALIVLIASITPALEIYDTVTTPRWSFANCNLLTAYAKLAHRNYLSTYLSREDSFPTWLFGQGDPRRPLGAETRICWPDRIYGEAKFNWLKAESRIWLRQPARANAALADHP